MSKIRGLFRWLGRFAKARTGETSTKLAVLTGAVAVVLHTDPVTAGHVVNYILDGVAVLGLVWPDKGGE